MMLRNPFFNPWAGLTAANRQQIKADVVAFFQANTNREAIPDEQVRAAVSIPLSETQWRAVLARLDDVLG